jgi:hypothetical protein
MDRDSRRERDIADTLFGGSLGQERMVVTPRSDDSLALERIGQGVEVWTPHAHHATDAGGQLVKCRLSDEATVIDDQYLVNGLGDLGEYVARYEHGAPSRSEVSEEVTQPPHTFWIQPVGGLVKDQQVRIPEERGGKTKALTHSERVSLHPAFRRTLQFHQRKNLVYSGVGDSHGPAQRSKMVASRPSGMKVGRLENRTNSQRWRLQLIIGTPKNR